MNFSCKTLLVIGSSFCFSFLLTFIYFILILNNIIIVEEGTKIINIALMSYSLGASLVFFILSLIIKNYKYVISNRDYLLELLCTTFPIATSLIAWNILSAIFVFFPIISFVIFISLLFAILLVGLIIYIILSKRKEIFFIFKNKKVKVLQYEKGIRTILLEKEIGKDELIFDDSNLIIQIKDAMYFIKMNNKKQYFKKKEYLINKII